MTALLVVLGGMVGAPMRYLIDRAVQSWHDTGFPWGTLTVNVAGCSLLGALAGIGSALPEPVLALVGIGFCGALTTYSTFSFETLRLIHDRSYLAAVMNVTGSVIAGTGAAFVGYAGTAALVWS